MTIFCSWCKKFMGEKEPKEDKSITHGICPECMKWQNELLDAREKK